MMIKKKWLKSARQMALALVAACGVMALTGCEDDDGDTALQPPSTDLSGSWQTIATTNGESGNDYATMQLTQNGNNVSGTAGGNPIRGTISGNIVDLVLTDTEEGYSTTVTGSVHPDNFNLMAGSWTDKTGNGTWRARR